ncbi:MAG: SRPBCC family protein [Actinomycetota bacterium]
MASVIEIVREAVVPARPDAVWTVVEDVRRLPMWLAFCERAELLEGSGIGRRQRIAGRWGSRRSEVDQVVTAYEPGRLLVWRHEAERINGKPAPRFASETTFSIWLEAESGGTRVRLVSSQEPAGPIRGLIMKIAGNREVARRMEKSLERLGMVSASL